MHGLLEDVGMKFSYSAEYLTLKDIKEKHCYVADNFDKEISGKNYFIVKIIYKQIEMTVNINFLMEKLLLQVIKDSDAHK